MPVFDHAAKDLLLAPVATGALTNLHVKDDTLFVHHEVVTLLRTSNIVSARGLLALLRAAPTRLQTTLGWDKATLDAYIQQLVSVLQGVLPAEALVEKTPKPRATGAIRPSRKLT